MKKTMILLSALALCAIATAQQTDTLRGRSDRYFYQSWYDQCSYYDEPNPFVIGGDTIVSFERWTGTTIGSPGDTIAARVSVPRCMLLSGVAVMVTDSSSMTSHVSLSDAKAAEYVMLMGGVEAPSGVRAVARWDTSAARTMLLPQDRRREQAGGGYGDMAFRLYEATFDNPVMVEDTFYLAGTFNSNMLARPSNPLLFETAPTFYGMVHNKYVNSCSVCIPETRLMRYNTEFESEWVEMCHECEYSGPFIPIPAMVELTVTSDSLPLGIAEGGGVYRSGDPVAIHATAAQDCRFVCWNDGNTDNPRVVYLCGDTSYSAFFVNDSSHLLKVLPNNNEWGTVSGGGVVHHGDEAVISATPQVGYVFTEWADYCTHPGCAGLCTENPRTVTVESDTVFTALFDPVPAGIDHPDATTRSPGFTIRPNPAHDMVTLTAAVEGRYTMRILDSRGSIVAEQIFNGTSVTVDVRTLPSGLYVATLQTEGRPESKALIKL